MRNIIVLLALIGVLAAAVLLDRASESWRPSISGEPGALLVAASFDGAPSEGLNDDWDQYDGVVEARVDAGALLIGIDEANRGPWSLARPSLADFDVRVQARAVAGSIANNAFGVIFRVQDSASYYRFVISSDGYYRLVLTLDNDSNGESAWIQSPLINQGLDAVNTVRVIGRGDRYRFFINEQPVQVCVPDSADAEITFSGGRCFGTMVDELVESRLMHGQVGVIAESLSEAGRVEVAFDHVLIYVPEAA